MPIPVSRTSNRNVCEITLGPGCADFHHDFPAFGELDGVAQQVGQHLPQTTRVARTCRGTSVVDAAGQLEPLPMRAHGERGR